MRAAWAAMTRRIVTGQSGLRHSRASVIAQSRAQSVRNAPKARGVQPAKHAWQRGLADKHPCESNRTARAGAQTQTEQTLRGDFPVLQTGGGL